MSLPGRTSNRWFDDPVIFHDGAYFVGGHKNVSSLLIDGRLGAKDNAYHLDSLTAHQKTYLAPILLFMERWPVFTPNPPHAALHRAALPLFDKAAGDRVKSAAISRIEYLARNGAPTSTAAATQFITAVAEAGLEEFLGLKPGVLEGVDREAAEIIAVAGIGSYDEETVRRGHHALEKFRARMLYVSAEDDALSPLVSSLRSVAIKRGCTYEEQLVGLYGQIVTGFLQPTTSGMASVVQFLHLENGRQDYVQNPSAFIEEVLRLRPPFHQAPRKALEDVTVEGQLLPRGSRVVLRLDVANLDPRVFMEPGAFQPSRERGQSLSFARGAYACIGSRVARLLIMALAESDIAKRSSWIHQLEWRQLTGTTMLAGSDG